MGAPRRAAVVLVLVLGTVGWAVFARLREDAGGGDRGPSRAQAAPVEIAPVERRALTLRRAWSGTIEAKARLVVAPRVAGRIERLLVDVADPVRRGQEVARLDDDEYVQAMAQVRADLDVATAREHEAESALGIAERLFERTRTLTAEGISTDSELDAASAERVAARAALEVAGALRARAEAALEESRVRLDYTRVMAAWTEGEEVRFVAERLVDEGTTVSANTPLLTVVSLDPVRAVVYATERDYARLRSGQEATLVTDAHAGRTFTGRIERIAPVFREASRQARVELTVENPDHALKPGMFVRAEVVLDRAGDSVAVPLEALTQRDGKTGVFVVDAAGARVSWRTVETGIVDGPFVQILGDPPGDRVVVLGQQLLEDGAAVLLPGAAPRPKASASAPEAPR